LKQTIKQIGQILNYLLPDYREIAFMRHNKKTWNDYQATNGKGEILLEVNDMASSVISCSYLANILAQVHDAAITAYLPKKKNHWSGFVDNKSRKMYRSFNACRFIYLNLDRSQENELNELFNSLYPRIQTKRDVEELSVDGVWFGDLLYDSYLMNYKVPTIDIGHDNFQSSLRDCLSCYIFWRDYIKSHTVKSVILSHCVYYWFAMVLRVAVGKDIPVYQCNASYLYYLNGERLWAYDDFYDYPETFRNLPQEVREEGVQMAGERLHRRFSGEVGVDMHYSSMSAYTKPKASRIIPDSPRIKILIATHCFFDSPHPYGVNLFPDFYEWLTFLGTISDKTDYDWYIKTHPDFLPGNEEVLAGFTRRFPKFTLIPSNSSHLQLIREGICFGLTVYGTIGFEYAALGIPVINASLCNPHIRYNFNIHPQSVEEYERILMDLGNQKLKIDINEVYEYYFMAFLHNTEDWLFSDFRGFLQSVGGYDGQFKSISYAKFLDDFTYERDGKIKNVLKRFIDSKNYRLQNI
jgi:hypothetical protein